MFIQCVSNNCYCSSKFFDNKKFVRIIYFPIFLPDKIDNIKINIYIFCNCAFWKHTCESQRARHMRGNVTRTYVTSWVHPCGLILTRACVMPRISQTLYFLGLFRKVLGFVKNSNNFMYFWTKNFGHFFDIIRRFGSDRSPHQWFI